MNEQTTLQKALFTIKKLKHLLAQQSQKTFEPVAIIGLGCRFPQAAGKEQFWEMLVEGRNVITQMPDQRWELLKGTPEISLRDKNHPYWGGFLADIDLFDAYYFGISPREAIRMDPQHRLLLEVAHEAIEDAGLTLASIAGSNTGIFASLYVSQLAHLQKMDTDMDALYLPTGNAISIAANRLSYLFDLHGPSVIIDSACSSSMTSLHLACLNLQNKVCDLALVCGAKLNLLPYVNYVLTKAKMLSPDGQCKTFDEDANGYVQGEGVGVVVLKPLSKALSDKDRIYAVISGTATNQDGKTNGLTAPNGLQQEILLNTAHQTADIDPHQFGYIECHGTGTFLGDPIEVQALGEVVGKNRSEEKPCWIGSIKTNIGHLEPAAGIASIIKVALALEKGKILPHLNFNTPNPHIRFDKYGFRIAKELCDWPIYGKNRLAGISGFGFGGTNAHIVMRDLAPDEKTDIVSHNFQTRSLEIFTLSAKNELALRELVKRWTEHLTNFPLLSLGEICFNVHLRRNHFDHRLAIIASTTSELHDALKNLHINFIPNKNIFISQEIKKNKSKIESFNNFDIYELATLYVNNANIDWKKFEVDRNFCAIEMPLYPWQHKSYWPPLGTKSESINENSHPLQGNMIISPLKSLQFEFTVSPEILPDLEDTYNILHVGYYLEILAFSIKQITGDNQFTIEDKHFLSPHIVNEKMKIILIIDPVDELIYDFNFYSTILSQKKDWIKNASGRINLRVSPIKFETIEIIKSRCDINEPAEILYNKVVAMGMPAGESIRWTQQYFLAKNEILCEFRKPKSTRDNETFILNIHPGVFDACIQPLFRLLPDEFDRPYIASGIKKIHFFGSKVEKPLFLYAKLKDSGVNGEKLVGDCYLMDEHGSLISWLEDITLTQLANKLKMDDLLQQKTILTDDFYSLPVQERYQKIILFLIEQISIIFSIPKEDIFPGNSLRDLGIDSLMALVLMRAIEVGLEGHYSMQALLEGPTINELADFLVKNMKSTETNQEWVKETRWIAYRKIQKEPRVKLFCFPYGGGGASIYRDWQQYLPNEIEVCPIQLPGRETRIDEKPITDIFELVELLSEQLKQELNVPYAFLGHSFGSLIAFELTRKIRRSGLPMPIHLFLSAFHDPKIPTKSLDRLLNQLEAINLYFGDIDNSASIEKLEIEQLRKLSAIFNENGLMGYNDYHLDKEILKILLPIFTGDMSIVKSYSFYEEELLDVPLTVFAGKKDGWVDYEEHLSWKEHTTNSCEVIDFDSGHMYIRESEYQTRILNKIMSTLTNYLNVSLV